MKVEYRVKPITRYVVTRWHDSEGCGGVDTIGAYDNGEAAYQVAYALCREEHRKSGEPDLSVNFVYPSIPDGVSVMPSSTI